MLVMKLDYEGAPEMVEMKQVAQMPMPDAGLAPHSEFETIPLHEKKVEFPSFLNQFMNFVNQMAKNFFFAIIQMSA